MRSVKMFTSSQRGGIYSQDFQVKSMVKLTFSHETPVIPQRFLQSGAVLVGDTGKPFRHLNRSQLTSLLDWHQKLRVAYFELVCPARTRL